MPASPLDIVCFSHDWGGDPLSKNHLMRLAAERNRVLWVNSIGYRAPTATARDAKRVLQKLKALSRERLKQVEPNIWTLSPLAIPAYGSSALRAVSREALAWQVRGAMKRLRFASPVNWIFNPAAATLAGRLGERMLIYYCVDDYLQIEGVNRQAMGALEDELIERADLLVASAATLQEAKTRGERVPLLVPHGVQYEHFRSAVSERLDAPAEVAGLPGPVIGYFGLMSRDWFDVPLVEAVADAYPDGSVVLLGKSTMDLSALERRPNVHLLGQKPFADLPRYCTKFDAALLPFPLTDLTRAANPLKIREYLAAGLPVASTTIPEVESVGGCFLGDGPAGFVDAVRAALADPTPAAERSDRMASESWRARYEMVERLIAERLKETG